MNMEKWSPIPGYEWYEISDAGRIRNSKGKLLNPRANSKGYLQVALYCGGMRKEWLVHRLVMLTFGKLVQGKPVVAHRNGIHNDNRFRNLRWDTQEGNLADTLKHGTRARGERHGAARLTSDQVRTMRAEHALGIGPTALSRRFGVAPPTVMNIVARRSWAWLN